MSSQDIVHEPCQESSCLPHSPPTAKGPIRDNPFSVRVPCLPPPRIQADHCQAPGTGFMAVMASGPLAGEGGRGRGGAVNNLSVQGNGYKASIVLKAEL